MQCWDRVAACFVYVSEPVCPSAGSVVTGLDLGGVWGSQAATVTPQGSTNYGQFGQNTLQSGYYGTVRAGARLTPAGGQVAFIVFFSCTC